MRDRIKHTVASHHQRGVPLTLTPSPVAEGFSSLALPFLLLDSCSTGSHRTERGAHDLAVALDTSLRWHDGVPVGAMAAALLAPNALLVGSVIGAVTLVIALIMVRDLVRHQS